MTNLPGVASESIIAFGQAGEYHTAQMSSTKQAAGFAPLETLPAEWYNNYMYLLDQHINQLQVLTVQIQEELSNIIATDSEATPSADTLNQVLTAINKLIAASRPVIATGSEPGLVKSSLAVNKISVDLDGVMTPNALGDWNSEFAAQTITQIVKTLKGQIEHEVDMRESRDVYAFQGTISGNQVTLTITSSDTTEHTATFNTVTGVSASVDASNVLTISVNGVSATVDLSGLAVASAAKATSAVYLRPASSSSTAVTADNRGNLKAHTLELT